ncbi:hypothetical protein IJS77_00300 [bacterium]|nr:hypothetical protein [bacterium]
MLKKFSVIFLLILFLLPDCGFGFCAEIVVDDSIHGEIASKYEIDKLPDLPQSLQNETIDDIFTPNEFDTQPTSKYTPQSNNGQTTTQSTNNTPSSNPVNTPPKQTITPSQPQTTQTVQKPAAVSYNDFVKINKGKKFKVVNNADLTDSLRKGTVITFISTQAETNKYITIPKGTVFKGVVEDSHTPNLSANGGLLVIKVNKMVYNGRTYNIDAKITIAKGKHIFFNNIKGKHKYWKNLVNSTSKGKKFYDRMWAKTKKYFKPGIEIIISPVAFVAGTVTYAANIAVSPVLALFSKGGKLTIPKYSAFEIKMLDDAIIYR